jgi:hypothetical protein
MKSAVLCALALSLALPALAEHPPLQTAKVISQNIDSYNGGTAVMPIGAMMVGVPIVRRSNTVVVETATQRLTWAEMGNGRHLVVLSVNGTVNFYQDGGAFVVLDSRSKKHKFTIMHAEAIGGN